MRCEYCGAEEDMPFTCSYCKGVFCAEHRLPEKHMCPFLWAARPPGREGFLQPRVPKAHSRPRLKFSYTELLHLLIGSVLVLLVGVSLIGWWLPLWVTGPSAALFAASFLLHEIAHKISAQRSGLWSEFRLDRFGAIITFISIFAPFKLVAPGAVLVAGLVDRDVMGKVALAGPATNLFLGYALLTLSQTTGGILPYILSSAAYINGIIAVFNLIPFGVFDGQKVFIWRRSIWVGAIVASVALVALTML